METSDEVGRKVIDTNFFNAVLMTKRVLAGTVLYCTTFPDDLTYIESLVGTFGVRMVVTLFKFADLQLMFVSFGRSFI